MPDARIVPVTINKRLFHIALEHQDGKRPRLARELREAVEQAITAGAETGWLTTNTGLLVDWWPVGPA